MNIVVVGAGPAGLTAAYQLMKAEKKPVVLEADPEYVGGISRTVSFKGFHFDVGGHRFFSKSKEVEDLWAELLPEEMLERQRKSRIYYRHRFLSYPLKPLDALMSLGPMESARCVLSFLNARVRPYPNPNNFEQVIVNSFGRRLFNHFFKAYTEKVWGMPCSEISADWAKQRIKGLSLRTAILDALLPGNKDQTDKAKVVTTLIDSFRYPRKGPGMMWRAAQDKIVGGGGKVILDRRVSSLRRNDKGWTVFATDKEGNGYPYEADVVISSAALSHTVQALEPAPPDDVMEAADRLRYRDFLTVALVVKDRNLFDDNWIYIQDPEVVVGRIQNFKAWSPEMVPDPSLNCYGLEYFCRCGDSFWNKPDDELRELAERELMALGLAHTGDVEDGCVVRMPMAYPVYDEHYKVHVNRLKTHIQEHCPGLYMVGRNGMHRYNNQDHSMVTAMLTVANVVSDSKSYDPWLVNQDAGYMESGNAGEVAMCRTLSRSQMT